ncbi:MAG TPA: Ig-like domain-containing protein [Herpetosiphonaceae bacterium]|nr:Ig-like domain-containing protein [Herpetosiphonaceae bacterium]
MRLALIVVSVLASSAFAAVAKPQPVPAVSPAAGAAAPGDARWDDSFAMEFGRRFPSGSSSYASFAATAVFNGELYVGGNFGNSPSFNTLSRMARWNGRQWKAVGSGDWFVSSNSPASISALVVHENTLYATGAFTSAAGVAANYIASWDGAEWTPLGSGLNGAGTTLASYGGDLYVGGVFAQAGGVAAKGVARWDGAAWHAVGDGLEQDPNAQAGIVTTLVSTPHGLYAGGTFGRSGAREVYTLALWNGSQWMAAIPELRGMILSMDWHNGALYFGGALSFGGATPTSTNLARWDGAQWQSASSGLRNSARVWMVRSAGDELYVAVEEDLYRRSGAAWEPFGPLPPKAGSRVQNVVVYQNNVHLLGSLACETTDCRARFVLAWDGSRWIGLGTGVDGWPFGIKHVAVVNGDMYISAEPGWGHRAGSEYNEVSRWDGAAWTDYAIPYSGTVTTLMGDGDRLYAAKSIGNSSVQTATIYLREGGSWTALPGTFNGMVNTLVYTDGVLYAGGYFTAVDGVAASGVARWDGAAWTGLGGGPRYNVLALAIHGGTVYAAGGVAPYPNMHYYGGKAMRWDGTGWSQIAATESPVYALAVTPDGTVYVGGRFIEINGLPAASFARLGAGGWEAVSAGLTGPVLALEATADGALYVGGEFSIAGVPGLKGIARYDGGVWQPLGSGVDGAVVEIEARGQDLYLGGTLTRAGDKSSEGVAIWHMGANAAPLAVADAASTGRGQAVDIAVLANDTDADQDALTITGLTAPAHGSVQIVGGTVRYAPAAGYVGSDSFGYTVSDGVGGTASATVTVSVVTPKLRIFLPLFLR